MICPIIGECILASVLGKCCQLASCRQSRDCMTWPTAHRAASACLLLLALQTSPSPCCESPGRGCLGPRSCQDICCQALQVCVHQTPTATGRYYFRLPPCFLGGHCSLQGCDGVAVSDMHPLTHSSNVAEASLARSVTISSHEAWGHNS